MGSSQQLIYTMHTHGMGADLWSTFGGRRISPFCCVEYWCWGVFELTFPLDSYTTGRYWHRKATNAIIITENVHKLLVLWQILEGTLRIVSPIFLWETCPPCLPRFRRLWRCIYRDCFILFPARLHGSDMTPKSLSHDKFVSERSYQFNAKTREPCTLETAVVVKAGSLTGVSQAVAVTRRHREAVAARCDTRNTTLWTSVGNSEIDSVCLIVIITRCSL